MVFVIPRFQVDEGADDIGALLLHKETSPSSLPYAGYPRDRARRFRLAINKHGDHGRHVCFSLSKVCFFDFCSVERSLLL